MWGVQIPSFVMCLFAIYYNSLIDKLTDCENGLCSCVAEDAQQECQCDDQSNTVCLKAPTGMAFNDIG